MDTDGDDPLPACSHGVCHMGASRVLVQEAFSLQSVLVPRLREFGLTENTTSSSSRSHLEWHEWAEDESVRRTKLIAFCFVHIHSVSYNVYPVLRSSEINLRLPCSTKK
jgi:hypothetical protein